MNICISTVLAMGFMLATGLAVAQSNTNLIGECPEAAGEAYLDVGNVRARILNNGPLFYRGAPSVYEVPKGSGVNSNFSSSIWLVGLVGGELRAASSRYGPWEFWPGPLDESGKPPSDCTVYDNLWEVSTDDIQQYIDTGALSANLRNWPWHLGAPVVDGDGNPHNYNLEGGDLPQLYGDQRIWWIMNDRGNEHRNSRSLPIGLEVQGSAHAFNHPGFGGDATFYEYTIVYKNEVPLEDAYFTLFADTDLGDFGDDGIGSDSLLHMGYTYNLSEFDGFVRDDGTFYGYGTTPPALGVVFLDTPQAGVDGLDNDRDGEIDEPEGEMIGVSSVLGGAIEVHEHYRPAALYNFMRGLRVSGEPVYEGMNGILDRRDWPAGLPLNTTRFIFSGDPAERAFWSELNLDGNGLASGGFDKKFIVNSGPFSMAPGDTVRFRIGIVWARGSDHLDSVVQLRQVARRIQSEKESYFASRPITPTLKAAAPNHVLGFDQNHPNPFTSTTTLRYSLPKLMTVRLAVYDVLGREVALLVDQEQDTGIYQVEFNADALPGGIYFARIELDHLAFTRRMVFVR